ncbi:MAG: hypothetical protein NWQ07_00620 [Flaviramulus sp.]|nr:hypothetical protein [Flaviramulus sp.]
MKKLLSLLFIILLCNASCNSNNDNELNNTCNVSNPTKNISWLREAIEELERSNSDLKLYFYVSQNTLEDETIFIFPNCCPQCSTLIPVFNCEGTLLGYVGDENFENSLLENDTIIWKPKQFSCF